METTTPPYAGLDPDTVLDAVAAAGLPPDGRLLALNSFENRVYQVGIEDQAPLVAKFYRPARWSDAAIAEEHAFALELADAELPVVPPLVFDGHSLLVHAGFRYSLYERRGGRAPELESADHLAWMGRLLARIHAVGARSTFAAREHVDADTLIARPAAAVLASPLLPPALAERYQQIITQLVSLVKERFARLEGGTVLRLHGDCHAGNVLWTDEGPYFVDLDDARTGPAVQDLWMLASTPAAMDALLEGYTQFRDFDPRERHQIEPLRIMRQVHWAAWVATRWGDPAFPRAFAYVGEPRWWEEHLTDLMEAASHLADG